MITYRLRIRPKCLVGVGEWDLKTTVLGSEVSMPVGISPTAMQRMAHPDGELANARGKYTHGINSYLYKRNYRFANLFVNI